MASASSSTAPSTSSKPAATPTRAAVSSPVSTPAPTATPIVTSTPSPTTLPDEVTVYPASVNFGDLYGIETIEVSFGNNSPSTIDRIDYVILAYDIYGTQIKSYGYYTSMTGFVDDIKLAQGNTTKPKTLGMYGYSGIYSVSIAVTKYHTTDGETVEYKDKRKYYSFSK